MCSGERRISTACVATLEAGQQHDLVFAWKLNAVQHIYIVPFPYPLIHPYRLYIHALALALHRRRAFQMHDRITPCGGLVACCRCFSD